MVRAIARRRELGSRGRYLLNENLETNFDYLSLTI